MFNLEPVTTSNIISIAQIFVVVAGFYFSWRSLEATRQSINIASQSLNETKNSIQIGARNLETGIRSLELSTSNAQAQLYNQMVVQGRDLQYKHADIYWGDGSADAERNKKDMHMGAVIGYYSACFEMRSILDLPPSVEKLLDADLKELMREETVRQKWERIRFNYSKEFVAHVNNVTGGV